MWTFFTRNKLFSKFQTHELIKHSIYGMWKSKFKKNYFILYSCVLWIEISLKVNNGHKNEELEKIIYEQYICIMNMKNGVILWIWETIMAHNTLHGMSNSRN
jgi:hypothetical protein